MPPSNVTGLVHLVGFLTGAALYGMLLILVARRAVDDRLPLLTAILGLIWNVSGLASFAIRDFAGHEPHPFLVAGAYSALGFLPAVAVHSVLRSESGGRTRTAAAVFIWIAYSVSIIAETLMFWTARHGEVPSPLALQVLTWSYAALTIPVLVLTRRRRGWARGGSIVALAVFAVSALHLSHHAGGRDTSLLEVAGHHASIPLIFAILYQDFRFALADLFLKRALALFALVAIASGVYFGIEVPLLSAHDFRSDPVAVGTSVIIWVAVALLYPTLQRVAARVVDRFVLVRANYAALREEIITRIAAADEPDAVLDTLSDALRGPLSAPEVRWTEGEEEVARNGVLIPVTTTDLPRYSLLIGPLRDGRRILSDEMEMLHGVALLAARRIDAIRLELERYQIGRLASEAELRALRAQVNPHFLFNALNTIGYLIESSPQRARDTLMKLTSLLRGVLRSGGSTTTLGEEIDLVVSYLEIEQSRFEERLRVEISVPSSLRAIRVPALVIQPLVENAIKHGIATSRPGGRVSVDVSAAVDAIVVRVENTGATASELEIAQGRKRGVGLANLAARLQHHYGPSAHLTLWSAGGVTTAEVRLPMSMRDGRSVARGA